MVNVLTCLFNVIEYENCGQVELLGFSTNKFAINCSPPVKFAQNKTLPVHHSPVTGTVESTCRPHRHLQRGKHESNNPQNAKTHEVILDNMHYLKPNTILSRSQNSNNAGCFDVVVYPAT